ncbi:MAG: hypothetical protein Q4P15_06330 [Propionibacteriaceae bacterium]|nr:hypothetical protein [Propionibacteriaceae bacterium]
MDKITFVSQDDGEYVFRVPSLEGSVSVIVMFGDAAEASEGRLTDDRATAHATLHYLLSHQEAADLPARIEIGDVVAAYADAVDQILASRP